MERSFRDALESDYRVLWLMDPINQGLRLPGYEGRPWNAPNNPAIVRGRRILGDLLAGNEPPIEEFVVRLGIGRKMRARNEGEARRMVRNLEASQEWVRLGGHLRFGSSWRRIVLRRLRAKINRGVR